MDTKSPGKDENDDPKVKVKPKSRLLAMKDKLNPRSRTTPGILSKSEHKSALPVKQNGELHNLDNGYYARITKSQSIASSLNSSCVDSNEESEKEKPKLQPKKSKGFGFFHREKKEKRKSKSLEVAVEDIDKLTERRAKGRRSGGGGRFHTTVINSEDIKAAQMMAERHNAPPTSSLTRLNSPTLFKRMANFSKNHSPSLLRRNNQNNDGKKHGSKHSKGKENTGIPSLPSRLADHTVSKRSLKRPKDFTSELRAQEVVNPKTGSVMKDCTCETSYSSHRDYNEVREPQHKGYSTFKASNQTDNYMDMNQPQSPDTSNQRKLIPPPGYNVGVVRRRDKTTSGDQLRNGEAKRKHRKSMSADALRTQDIPSIAMRRSPTVTKRASRADRNSVHNREAFVLASSMQSLCETQQADKENIPEEQNTPQYEVVTVDGKEFQKNLSQFHARKYSDSKLLDQRAESTTKDTSEYKFGSRLPLHGDKFCRKKERTESFKNAVENNNDVTSKVHTVICDSTATVSHARQNTDLQYNGLANSDKNESENQSYQQRGASFFEEQNSEPAYYQCQPVSRLREPVYHAKESNSHKTESNSYIKESHNQSAESFSHKAKPASDKSKSNSYKQESLPKSEPIYQTQEESHERLNKSANDSINRSANDSMANHSREQSFNVSFTEPNSTKSSISQVSNSSVQLSRVSERVYGRRHQGLAGFRKGGPFSSKESIAQSDCPEYFDSKESIAVSCQSEPAAGHSYQQFQGHSNQDKYLSNQGRPVSNQEMQERTLSNQRTQERPLSNQYNNPTYASTDEILQLNKDRPRSRANSNQGSTKSVHSNQHYIPNNPNLVENANDQVKSTHDSDRNKLVTSFLTPKRTNKTVELTPSKRTPRYLASPSSNLTLHSNHHSNQSEKHDNQSQKPNNLSQELSDQKHGSHNRTSISGNPTRSSTPSNVYDVGGSIYSSFSDARSERLHSYPPGGQPAMLKRCAATYIATGKPLERIVEVSEDESTLQRVHRRGKDREYIISF